MIALCVMLDACGTLTDDNAQIPPDKPSCVLGECGLV